MNTPWTGLLTVAALLVLALASGGCESTPLLAPTGATLTLLASPVEAAPDLNRDETGSTFFSTIYGQLLDTSSGSGGSGSSAAAATAATPLVGVTITFNASGGNLRFNACQQGVCTVDGALCPGGVVDCVQPSPGPLSVKTDSAGVVEILLAVTENDPASVSITALSGTINQTVSVANPLGAPNDEPEAEIGVSPASPADASNGPVTVTFYSESSDPDGDEITCYKWTINSTVDPADIRFGTDIVSKPYSEEQSLDVLLQVTDDPDAAGANCKEGVRFSPNVDAISGYLICANTAPTAVLSVLEVDQQPNTVQYTLDGSGSNDDESDIRSYLWDCDNGQEPTGVEATCLFERSNTTRFYDIELVVTDYSPEDGCELESEPAVRSVTVPALGAK